jgi:hypothetical protein
MASPESAVPLVNSCYARVRPRCSGTAGMFAVAFERWPRDSKGVVKTILIVCCGGPRVAGLCRRSPGPNRTRLGALRLLLVVVVLVREVFFGVVVGVGGWAWVVGVGWWDPFGGAVAAFAGYRDGARTTCAFRRYTRSSMPTFGPTAVQSRYGYVRPQIAPRRRGDAGARRRLRSDARAAPRRPSQPTSAVGRQRRCYATYRAYGRTRSARRPGNRRGPAFRNAYAST